MISHFGQHYHFCRLCGAEYLCEFVSNCTKPARMLCHDHWLKQWVGPYDMRSKQDKIDDMEDENND